MTPDIEAPEPQQRKTYMQEYYELHKNDQEYRQKLRDNAKKYYAANKEIVLKRQTEQCAIRVKLLKQNRKYVDKELTKMRQRGEKESTRGHVSFLERIT